ncbi:MAG: hypothetical protein IKS93_04500 [Methanobrevibacter sp.]|nr:hypothetical protein [Methanobrevibacter sp.]
MRRIESVTAYHSTRQKGLKKFESRTTTATIDTGEGAHVHGWGLYLQADEMENRMLYLEPFAEEFKHDKIVTLDGKPYNAYYTDDILTLNDYQSISVYSVDNADPALELVIMILANGYRLDECAYYLGITQDEVAGYEKEAEEDPNFWDESELPEVMHHYSADELWQAFDLARSIKNYDVYDSSFGGDTLPDGTHYEKASQYTVEIPDDMVFIDEQNSIPEWLIVKKLEVFGQYDPFDDKDIPWNNVPEEKKNVLIKKALEFYTGYSFYQNLVKSLGTDEQASLWLSEQGVDGMTYEGGRDGGCFVIYNCDKLKIVGEY